jgi:anthranilate synthase component I
VIPLGYDDFDPGDRLGWLLVYCIYIRVSAPAIMMIPEFPQFKALAAQGNFIPVYQEWVADLDTPISAWQKVCSNEPYSFLLESVDGGEQVGRYSFLGCDPLWVMEARGDKSTKTDRDGSIQEFTGNPFTILADCLTDYQPVKLTQLPSGIGGLFGFWGYELIKWIEPRVPVYPAQPDDLPDGCWMQVDHLMIFDQVKRKIFAVAYADLKAAQGDLPLAYQRAVDRVQSLLAKLQKPHAPKFLAWTPPAPLTTAAAAELPANYRSNTTKEKYCASVEKAQEYIKAGDIFQVVISQRLSTNYVGQPFDLYRSLRLVNPSPYMAYFNFGDWQIIGSSPEVMVKAEKHQGHIKTTLRPIAGTRPRGATPASDDALAAELLADPKEVAEHIMLVDMGRNDLGRVCASGTIVVDELMSIERYSHVMHIVSNVVGELAADKTAWDLMQACFPAGTVSGAPKIRALEIIHELEGCRREPYAGVYGYYDFEGQLNTAITLRTMVVRPQGEHHEVFVQAGAGLVADSNPEKEYEETLNKARGLLEAIRCLD